MRLRITFAKRGALRYTGHLDLHHIWERTIRRAGLPLSYTQGFNPGPRIQLASALPLGFSSRAEMVDLWLEDALLPADALAIEALQSATPPGLVLASIERVAEADPPLQTRVVSAEYEVTFLDEVDGSALGRKITTILNTPSLPRLRREKTYDLRPLIEVLELRESDPAAPLCLFMRLAARQGATGRPEEVLSELGMPFESTRIERTQLVLR